MTNLKSHLFLNNPRGEKKHFNASRSFSSPVIPPKAPEAYRPQKNKLKASLSEFNTNYERRVRERTLQVPAHLEYLEVHFLSIFNNNDTFQTKTRFNDFGMTPVFYTNFNQSVIFSINNAEKFNSFIKVLEDFIESTDQTLPKGKKYAIATIIYDFEFLTTEKILGYCSDDVLLSLLSINGEGKIAFDAIYHSLIEYLDDLQKIGKIAEYDTDEHSTIEIKGVSKDIAKKIAENFDIIYNIQSLRVATIKENEFNQPHLTWDLVIHPPENEIIIGVLDNGVREIDPLKKIIKPSSLDITSPIKPNPNNADLPHGTIVSSIAATGRSIFDPLIKEITADAYILPIKILEFGEGCFNIYQIEKAIIKAIKQGVKIFNLSVCGPGKNYNSTISEFAYLLDKLTYNNDILIMIAAGNLDSNDINAMQSEDGENSFHKYPNHFYNPYEESFHHVCESCNICVPAESYNNITIGALAENYREDSKADLTPFKELPAFYSRKHYIDPLRKVNGTPLQDSQKNKNVNKPDIVMAGGDRLNPDAGMQVLGFGQNGNDYYTLDSGTSLAAPQAANLAAKILAKYPDLTMQSVKALILNSAEPLLDASFLKDLEKDVKDQESNNVFGKLFKELDTKQKKAINSKFNSDSIYKSLVGFGTPSIEKALYSSDKSVGVIIQDNIATKTHKVININIPEFLLKYSKSTPIITIKATICYKFFPVWGNHLAYNPLHISFNFTKSLEKDNPSMTSDIISNRNHDYFNSFYTVGMSDKEKQKAKRMAVGIKKDIQPWSEDYFPPSNKPFSNVQSLSLKIKKEEIRKVKNQISLVIRCTHKADLEKSFLEFLTQKSHDFSIALEISEKKNTEL